MIVRTLDELRGTDRVVEAPTWKSTRILLKKDGMGFSLHQTTLYAGTVTRMWYKNHLEAVLCVSGHGELEDLATGQKHRIEPGTTYALDQHDKHILRAETELTMICVFNPPCTGQETHDEEGAYPLLEETTASNHG